MRTWTAKEWIDSAVMHEGTIFWMEADGHDHLMEHYGSGLRINIGLRGDADGSIFGEGDGNGDVFRDGSGNGDAHRLGPGDGDAVRRGPGNGNAVREHGPGDALRIGSGDGSAFSAY